MSPGISTAPAVRGSGFEVNLPASFTAKLFINLCSLFENVLTRCREGQNCDKSPLFLLMHDLSRLNF